MNELHLFAGAGGGLLASELLGFTPICAVEQDEYCQRILIERQNDKSLPCFPIWGDIRTFDGKPWRGSVDLVSGGFPCQAFSSAARGRNIAERNLWPEMRRVVQDVQPKFVFAENVSKSAILEAQNDLLEDGYSSVHTKMSAADLGADHLRERFWLLAYTDVCSQLCRKEYAETPFMPQFYGNVWQTNPNELRVSDGVARRMDRLKAVGNGQVPLVAAMAFLTLYMKAFWE
jgi:DNA (cytosine-5)-methyltransferase 1